MPDTAPPRIFISYSHDSTAHEERVLALANRLRGDGIDATIDQDHVSFPPGGWARWSEAQVRNADFVVMVCTETYLQRHEDEAPAGVGRGVIWEVAAIRELLYDVGAASRKFVPVMFSGGKREHVPIPLRGGYINRIETDEGYRRLLHHIQNPDPRISSRDPEAKPPAALAPASPSAPVTSTPHPRVEDLFVGRLEEREKLDAALFPTSGTRRPVVVSGMAGVGKSYLVDRFFWENADRFPGGYLRLALDPDNPANAAKSLPTLRDRLKLPAGDGVALAARLLMPLTLLHIENADSFDAGRVVGELAGELPGCALVVSARFRRLGVDTGWPKVPLAPFDERTALEKLRAELGEDTPRQESWPALVAALGFLPLALHLAAGHLRADYRADAFLRRLRAKNLALTGTDPADPTFRDRSRALLSDTFELSLSALRQEGGAEGDNWLAGFSALGHAPAAGFGESLGAAISGLSTEAFEDMALAASRLSLLDRVPRGAESAFRLHPLLAELVRSRSDAEAALARITEWFIARLPQGGEDQGLRWREVGGEIAALTGWLAQVSPAARVRIARAGMHYATQNGPYQAWLRLCEAALTGEIADAERSDFLWVLVQVALSGGFPDRALAAAREKRELDLKRGAEREAAISAGFIADILQARGQLDEALKICNEEELPVYERLGDVRLRAVTMGEIADILEARGQLDEALKIRNEEQLPVYERLGDVRERAVTMGRIADILEARGQLDEALKILREEVLPVYERLGDVRSRAVTMGRVADILQARGQLEEALKIRNEEELPVFERLGDVRSRAVTMGKIADILQARGQLDEALKIRNQEQLPVYERLGDVRGRAVTMHWISQILDARGNSAESLRILREEVLPVYERLGDVHALLRGRCGLAAALLKQGDGGYRDEARRLLYLALEEARRLKLPEVQQIEQIIEQAGLSGT